METEIKMLMDGIKAQSAYYNRKADEAQWESERRMYVELAAEQDNKWIDLHLQLVMRRATNG